MISLERLRAWTPDLIPNKSSVHPSATDYARLIRDGNLLPRYAVRCVADYCGIGADHFALREDVTAR